jgi:DNA-binding transcriptional regulator YdaS (Cro superfamily)
MKNQTKTQLAVCSSLALVLALALCSPVQAQSAQTAEEKTPTAAAMMERCQEMKEQKQKLSEDMKAQDAQLTEQLADMNRAPEDKQMGLMAAILTNMVEHRIAMDARRARMEDAMMQHMMQHMQMGKESMSQCPTMKSMKDMGENAAGAHKEPQEQQR